MQMQMLRSLKNMRGYVLGAQDGEIGRCKDFLFDTDQWVVRYLVADTRKWLPGRKVLISPISIGEADGTTRTLKLSLTKSQIESAPPLDSDAPVSRQYEIAFNQYYDWPPYWGGSSVWGAHPIPWMLQERMRHQQEVEREILESADDAPNLRSAGEVTGYGIRSADDRIGHVEDFIVDTMPWMIRYLVVDTSNWLPASRKVLVAPDWVQEVNWIQKRVAVALTKEQIKESPEYDPALPVNREYEIALYDFYGRPYYW